MDVKIERRYSKMLSIFKLERALEAVLASQHPQHA